MNKEIKMKRLDLWKAKLKAAKAELRIRAKERQASTRTVERVLKSINQLEGKINDYLAKP